MGRPLEEFCLEWLAVLCSHNFILIDRDRVAPPFSCKLNLQPRAGIWIQLQIIGNRFPIALITACATVRASAVNRGQQSSRSTRMTK